MNIHFVGAAIFCFFMTLAQAGAQEILPEAQRTYDDVKKTLGTVPEFLRRFPQEAVEGAWREFKDVQLNPKSALPARTKELIGLSVAAQIPCRYCTYFHDEAARANGASEREVSEAVAISALTSNWSTTLNGSMTEEQAFRRDVDRMFQAPKKATAASGAATAKDTLAQIESTYGFVPGFMRQISPNALPGLWSETHRLLMSPGTALSPKEKDLVGLAVSAQFPCRYCTYYNLKSAKANGVSEAEIKEAVAMASLTRHWSAFLNGIQMDESTFRREVSQIMKFVREQPAPPKQMGGQAGGAPTSKASPAVQPESGSQ